MGAMVSFKSDFASYKRQNQAITLWRIGSGTGVNSPMQDVRGDECLGSKWCASVLATKLPVTKVEMRWRRRSQAARLLRSTVGCLEGC